MFCAQGWSQVAVEEESKDSVKVSVGELRQGKGGLKSKVMYHAQDSVRLLMKSRKVMLYGKAEVTYEDMKLEADFIEVSFETNDIHAVGIPDSNGIIQGKPIFTTDGEPYYAEEMWYNFKTKKGISTGVVTQVDQGTVRGEKILKDSLDQMYIRHASYTTCNAEHPHFWIAASKFKVIPEKQAVSGPANLVIAGVNTPIVLPFGFFPIQQKRSKGVLIGKFGEQQRFGFYLTDFGYYTPVNEYIDLKLTGDFYFRGSWGLGLSSNYKRLYKYNGNFQFKYNHFLFGEPESADFSKSNEIRIVWNYRRDAKAKPGRSFTANVNYVTKNQQRFTSSNVDDILATTANSTVTYSRSFFNRKLFFTLNNRITQNLTTGDLNVDLPDINLNMNRIQPFKSLPGNKSKLMVLRNFGFTYNGMFKNNISVNQDSMFEFNNRVLRIHDDLRNGLKNGIRHSLSGNTSFKVLKYFTLSPSVSYTDVWYSKTLSKTWDTDTLLEDNTPGFSRSGWYSASLALNTTVYGMKTFKKGKIAAIRHVIRPGISGGYAPQYQEEFNAGYRQVQVDTMGNMDWYSIYDGALYGGPSGSRNASLNFSISNNFEMKVRTKDTANPEKKIVLLDNLGFTGGYNFIADSLKLSNIGVSAFTSLFDKKLRVNSSLTVDPYNFAEDTAGINRRIDQYMFETGKLGRITSARLSLNTSLKPDMFRKKKPGEEKSDQPEMDSRGRYFSDFSAPWDLNLQYTINYSQSFDEEARREQTIKYQGNLKLTQNWRIGFTSGYNFVARKTAISSVDFARDLHCWEFNFHWVPVGTYKQFNFELRVKASTLQDLKIRRQQSWFDAVN
ncbi:MAG: LPS-assembly protein LptD [Flavobacteriales bacterium]|nr:LPS-assembly protein LptD [Bacteroidota bacterium]MCB9240252.1 LPS-assembly protein LptD [Flavobacteriales bacterium]